MYTPSTTAATNSPTNQSIDGDRESPSQAVAHTPELPRPPKPSPAHSVSTDTNPELRGLTPLHLAVQLGNLKIARFLVSRGCDVNAVATGTGQTVLHMAATGGHAQMIPYLIRCGISMNHRDVAGNTALHLAVMNRHDDIVEILVDAGALMDIPNKYF